VFYLAIENLKGWLKRRLGLPPRAVVTAGQSGAYSSAE
jgi:hypothetical protein